MKRKKHGENRCRGPAGRTNCPGPSRFASISLPGNTIFLFSGFASPPPRAILSRRKAARIMVQVPRETIEKILSAIEIVDLIGSYVPLKKSGVSYKACCPFHHERTPSFTVNPARQSFKCFGCGIGGDALSFVREFENLPFMDALAKLAARAGVPLELSAPDPEADRARRRRGRLLDLHREAARFFHELLLKDPAAAHGREYLRSRGFDGEMARRWTIGWMPGNPQQFLHWAREQGFNGRELVNSGIASLRDESTPAAGLYVRFRDRLMFCIRNEMGDVIAFSGRQLREDPNSGKYVNSPETPLFRKSQVLFALDRARRPILKEGCALLCEGQIDVIVCHERGLEHAVAPLGTAFTRRHARLLRRYTKSVLICYDADSAGAAAAERTFRELAAEGLAARVVEMPAGDDPDTFLRDHGVEEFRGLLEKAAEFFELKIRRARAAGRLDSAAERQALTTECVELLAAMSDANARDYQIRVVATYLQMTEATLRQAVADALAKPRPEPREEYDPSAEPDAPPPGPTPLHRTVAYLCHLALGCGTAQHFLAEQFECIHEAGQWLEGVPLLERILAAAPDPASPAAVNAYLATLPEADRLALSASEDANPPEPGAAATAAAESALATLSGIVLHRRDARIKADLKQPGLDPARMLELMEEAKQIRTLLRGVGQRHEFDDDLPPSTYREKDRRRWRGKDRR